VVGYGGDSSDIKEPNRRLGGVRGRGVGNWGAHDKRRCQHSGSVTLSKHKEFIDMTSGTVSRSSPSSSDLPGVISSSISLSINPPEDLPSVVHIIHGPELLERISSAQCPRFCLFKPMLFTPKQSMQLHRASRMVYVIDRVTWRAQRVCAHRQACLHQKTEPLGSNESKTADRAS